MPRIFAPIRLKRPDRLELERWVDAHGPPQQVTLRCRVILAAAEGRQDQVIAEGLQINFKTVARWRGRFRTEASDCLWEVAPGRGRKRTYSESKVTATIDTTLQSHPAGATHWSCRSMAKEHGVSKDTMNRIWQIHQINPHRTQVIKLSRGPTFLGEANRRGGAVPESTGISPGALR